MSHDVNQDQMLDVPNSELVSQDELDSGRGEGNALLAALGGGSGPDDFLDDDGSSQSGSKITPRAAIIAGIAVLGGGMIYGMRQYEIRQGMSMQISPTMSIETSAQVTPLTRRQEDVLLMLRASVGPAVTAPNLRQNPMELEEQSAPAVAGTTPTVQVGPDIEALTKEFMKAFDSLKMTSVVPTGRMPMCVINQKAVTVGATVGEYFKIREIAKDPTSHKMYVKVELAGFDPAVDGAELILQMRSRD